MLVCTFVPVSRPDAFRPHTCEPVTVADAIVSPVAAESVMPVAALVIVVCVMLESVNVPLATMPSRKSSVEASPPPTIRLSSPGESPPITALVAFTSWMPTRLFSKSLSYTVVPVVVPVANRPAPVLSSTRLPVIAKPAAFAR